MMKTAKTDISHHLMGKAGVGLLMFHFGRLGYEFTQTSEGSHAGDLWVDFGQGPEAVEIKATRLPRWGLRSLQTSRVRWVAFVNLTDADCWLLPAAKILQVRASTADGFQITGAQVIAMGAQGLHHAAPVLSDAAKKPPAKPREKSGKVRRVKKKLASGEIKIYEYR